jgi:hypothetical protein
MPVGLIYGPKRPGHRAARDAAQDVAVLQDVGGIVCHDKAEPAHLPVDGERCRDKQRADQKVGSIVVLCQCIEFWVA